MILVKVEGAPAYYAFLDTRVKKLREKKGKIGRYVGNWNAVKAIILRTYEKYSVAPFVQIL